MVFTTRMGMGHLALAHAVIEAFSKGSWRSQLHFSPFWEEHIYRAFCVFSPSLFGVWFEFAKLPWITQIVRECRGLEKKHELRMVLQQFKPDLVVSTHFLFNSILGRLRREFGFKLFNLLTDPRSIHPLLVAPNADINLVYDKSTAELISQRHRNSNVAVLGWLVRKKFYSAAAKPRTDDSKLTILVTGGSGDTMGVARVLPSFLKLSTDAKLILAADEGSPLRQAFDSFRRRIENGSLSHRGRLELVVPARPRQRIAELISETDVVVGKAGPNLIFESVAACRPFVAVCHYHGHEAGNLNILKAKRLGWVAEDLREFEQLIYNIGENPQLLETIRPHIQVERSSNFFAAQRIVDLAERATTS